MNNGISALQSQSTLSGNAIFANSFGFSEAFGHYERAKHAAMSVAASLAMLGSGPTWAGRPLESNEASRTKGMAVIAPGFGQLSAAQSAGHRLVSKTEDLVFRKALYRSGTLVSRGRFAIK
jgi:hypothetical protein